MQSDVYYAFLVMNKKLDWIIKTLSTEGEQTMAWIDDMRTEISNNTSVSQSAVVAVNRLADQLQEVINSGADPAELQALVDTLRNNDAAVAAAVAARTSAAQEPPPTPVEPEVTPEG